MPIKLKMLKYQVMLIKDVHKYENHDKVIDIVE